jgi:hypothetical protein
VLRVCVRLRRRVPAHVRGGGAAASVRRRGHWPRTAGAPKRIAQQTLARLRCGIGVLVLQHGELQRAAASGVLLAVRT